MKRMTAIAGAIAAVASFGCGGDEAHSLANGDYRVAVDGLLFEVAPAGARVVDVELPGGTNLLTGAATDATNFGSTFWTSPQDWGWPPPAEIDTATYEVSGTNARLSFAGPTSARLGARISKRFAAPAGAKAAIEVSYEIAASGGDRMFAPWEITRVFPGGLTFFPTGQGAPMAGGGFALPPTTDGAGCTWYQHPGSAPGANQKLLADGSGGWLAHVAGDVVLVKKFADVPPGMAAPGEAEIEIFVQGQGAYVELEQQGVYQPVADGQSLTWPVTWIVQALPAGVAATAGNSDLVAFVQALVDAQP